MHFTPEPISQQRLQRFHRWALLWLKWFAAFLAEAGACAPLSKQAEAVAHRWLDSIERIVCSIVMLHAARRVRRVQPRKGIDIHRRNGTSLMRAVIGSAMRRRLRSENLTARIAALSQNLEPLVARLLKRLPRGLTRRRAIITAPEAGPLEVASTLIAPLCADSS